MAWRGCPRPAGMSVAFLGMVFYTLIKQSEATAKAAAKAAELQAALDREAQGREGGRAEDPP